jgi:hypothetical protein
MSMSIEQMIESFKEQQKEVVEEVRNLENQINSKKEDYFKLQGAIEALTIQLNPPENAGVDDQTGQSPSQPPGMEMPDNLTDIPGIDVIPATPEG